MSTNALMVWNRSPVGRLGFDPLASFADGRTLAVGLVFDSSGGNTSLPTNGAIRTFGSRMGWLIIQPPVVIPFVVCGNVCLTPSLF